MNLPDSIPDAVTEGTLPRLALVVAVMILRNPRDVYQVDQIADWCGIARRTTFAMLYHLRDVHFQIIQVKNGIKIVPIRPNSTEIAPFNNSAAGGTPHEGTLIPDDYPNLKAREWAKAMFPSIDVSHAADAFLQHHQLKGSVRHSWEAAWRSWMKRAHKDQPDDNGKTRAATFGDAISTAISSNPFG